MPRLSSDPWNFGERMDFEVSLQKQNFLLILENSHADWRKGGKAVLCLYQFETTRNLLLSVLLQRDENVQCLGCLKISAGGRRNNWMMSFHQQMAYSLPEQAHLPTALWQPAHPAFECQSAWLGEKHRTCCSQWLRACIFTRGLVGLGFLSRLSLEWVKGETARREPHIKIFFPKKKKKFLSSSTPVQPTCVLGSWCLESENLVLPSPCLQNSCLAGTFLLLIDSVILCYGLNRTSLPSKPKGVEVLILSPSVLKVPTPTTSEYDLIGK